MHKDNIEKISGFIGAIIISVFVLGLAYSISSGAAGFWGGLPFWIICLFVLGLVFYDLWDTCLRKE
jgi:sterol desaturase/sphingolipid hydroxylase (fatty acid hydroxylase superfamily)